MRRSTLFAQFTGAPAQPLPYESVGNAIVVSETDRSVRLRCDATVVEVTAIDHLADALNMGSRLAGKYLEGDSRIEWLCADLETATPARNFDLATCFFYLDRGDLETVIDGTENEALILKRIEMAPARLLQKQPP